MSQDYDTIYDENVQVVNATGSSSVVLVCEHASPDIPAVFDHLGLSPDLRKSHVTWDPGAMAVAQHLAQALDAALVAGAVSRLVYDCNRPPDAADAMPAQSEIVAIPGNVGLTQADRDARTKRYYVPFQTALAGQISTTKSPIIVTIHSFTPIYFGKPRTVEIGILHDTDTRLAHAMARTTAEHTDAKVVLNQPYGAGDGVTHTLKEHAVPAGHLNVMIEIRNDLIDTPTAQFDMANTLAACLVAACNSIGAAGDIKCVA
jgi:predicted N-formylglutamate amidohydrolase